MSSPRLQRSQEFVRRGLSRANELAKPDRPLTFTSEGLEADMQRLESELVGWVVDDHGERMMVVSERDATLRNFLYVEMLDFSTGERLGHVTLLFRPEQGDFFIGFLNLEAIRGRGFGRNLSDKFRAFIPQGVRMNSVIEEKTTRRMLTAMTQDLMARGEITDWTVTSPLRPAPKDNETIFLPAQDQEKLEASFLAHVKTARTPILSLLRNFRSTFHSLRGCLTAGGHFSFILTYRC